MSESGIFWPKPTHAYWTRQEGRWYLIVATGTTLEPGLTGEVMWVESKNSSPKRMTLGREVSPGVYVPGKEVSIYEE